MRWIVAIVTALLIVMAVARVAGAAGPGWMLELKLDGRAVEGTPLGWDDKEVRLLGRDGRLWTFAPDKARDFRKTADRFRPYSVSELRAGLLREMGGDFEVTGTGHYLVVHPRGTRDLWAARFEDLYRSMVHYFSVRGFRMSEPAFPLVAVVCRDQAEFARYAAREGVAPGGGVLGYYSSETNRIALFDTGAGKSGAADWRQNAATVIHEATHQTAFNTGVHSRYAPPPAWLAEGLATMFEAPGVHDARSHPAQSDRVNRGRLDQFRKSVAPAHQPKLLENLVASDEVFRRAPGAAYAEAWALTFFLVETEPGKFAAYLAKTAARPAFSDYPAAQRTADFTAVFGADWRMLEARFLRFIAAVK